MTGTPSHTSPILHEPFLARAADGPDEAGGHALGAFLTLRLVDQFAVGGTPPMPAALHYQTISTRDYLNGLHPATVELGHLKEIARLAVAAEEQTDPRLLWPPLLAFAYWLEQEHRLDESDDVLRTADRLSDGRDAEEELAGLLHRARVVRKLSRYDEATELYRSAGDMAGRLADGPSERRARIGQGIVLYKLGNLPQAERLLNGVIRDARVAGDPDAEARARHDLANVFMLMSRPAVAVPEAYRAFELYETEQQRVRALGDLGMAFKMLGHFRAAEDAFAIVLASSACTLEIRINTMLELVEVAAGTANRISFERWRRELEPLTDVMRPDAQVDYRIKLAGGWAAFGQPERAEPMLRDAVALAEQHHLNAYLFTAEQALADLAKQGPEPDYQEGLVPPSQDGEALRVAGRLHALRAGTATT